MAERFHEMLDAFHRPPRAGPVLGHLSAYLARLSTAPRRAASVLSVRGE